MGFTEVQDLGCDVAITLGGINKKTNKKNPTQIEGYFLGSRDIASKFSKTGFAKMHVLQTPDGNVGVYGKTDLDRKMLSVAPGVCVRVTQSGSVPTNKGNDMLKFKVEVDAENTIDVNLVTAYANAEQPDDSEETDLDSHDSALDETPAARTVAPARPAPTPSSERQAKVQALLNGRR